MRYQGSMLILITISAAVILQFPALALEGANAPDNGNATLPSQLPTNSALNGTDIATALTELFFIEQTYTLSASSLTNSSALVLATGNGTLRLPNSSGWLNFTSTGTKGIDSTQSFTVTNETIVLNTERESVSMTLFQANARDLDNSTTRNSVIAVFTANSRGPLAPLDGLIGVGHSEVDETGATNVRLWNLQVQPQ